MCIFFFFKQKTAYEMRISDWSSDVCSSDLAKRWLRAKEILGALDELAPEQRAARIAAACGDDADLKAEVERLVALDAEADSYRSEEHTSELQSLMRISYAVLCLYKNTRYKQIASLRTTHARRYGTRIKHNK